MGSLKCTTRFLAREQGRVWGFTASEFEVRGVVVLGLGYEIGVHRG